MIMRIVPALLERTSIAETVYLLLRPFLQKRDLQPLGRSSRTFINMEERTSKRKLVDS
jgi:hypothetical protein